MSDPRSLKALDVAEAYANGTATLEELKKARDAAWDAYAVGNAAAYAAWAVARAAAGYAAWGAAAYAARAARDAVTAADYKAETQAQTQELIRICKETT
jgi:hypothetical protein